MWLIQQKVFNTLPGKIDKVRSDLANATTANNLTIIVGNGPSQSASYLQSLSNGSTDELKVGWKSAVLRAAEEAGIPMALRSANQNLLALSQAVFESLGPNRQYEARQLLLKEIRTEFLRSIGSTLIHDLLVEINPATIVTTNYDLQLERVFAERGKHWRAVVRNGSDDVMAGEFDGTQIFKMHGTLEPERSLKDHYLYTHGQWREQPESSVVISESDYDECLAELKMPAAEYFMSHLRRPCLIIGKGLVWQDLSFLYALRATRNERPWCYLLTPFLGDEELLNLSNLHIIPIQLNMPAMPQDGHFYASLVKALISLFSNVEPAYQDKIDTFIQSRDLIHSPTIVALGLAAFNTMGRVHHTSGIEGEKVIYTLPREGRRSFRMEAEESPGGSALTALGAFSTLDWKEEHRPSLISVIGKNDIYKTAILEFCREKRIDTDGVSAVSPNTWRSTVLIHDVAQKDNIFAGQRIFLDQGFGEKIILDNNSIEQFEQQLNPASGNLKLVYFDKFLALPYPFNPKNKGEQVGFLVENQSILKRLIEERPDVDVLYETGTAGSQNLIVESALNQYINILTVGFPFFARNVLSKTARKFGRNLSNFSRTKWFEMDFKKESRAIQELLRSVGLDADSKEPCEFDPPEEWIKSGARWAGRDCPRRWMIATLHQYGALAVDLNANRAWYSPAPVDTTRPVVNTTGAGDLLRGAFCYALVYYSGKLDNDFELLKRCTDFAVLIAEEKCRHIKMSEAFQQIRKLSETHLP